MTLVLVQFTVAVVAAYYLVARAEVTRWWWEGILQAEPRWRGAGNRAPYFCHHCRARTWDHPSRTRDGMHHPATCINCADHSGELPLTAEIEAEIDAIPPMSADVAEYMQRCREGKLTPEEAAELIKWHETPPAPTLGTIIRQWLDRLLTCPACSGFWLGIAAYGLLGDWAPHTALRWLWGGAYGLLLCPLGFWPLKLALGEAASGSEEDDRKTTWRTVRQFLETYAPLLGSAIESLSRGTGAHGTVLSHEDMLRGAMPPESPGKRCIVFCAACGGPGYIPILTSADDTHTRLHLDHVVGCPLMSSIPNHHQDPRGPAA